MRKEGPVRITLRKVFLVLVATLITAAYVVPPPEARGIEAQELKPGKGQQRRVSGGRRPHRALPGFAQRVRVPRSGGEGDDLVQRPGDSPVAADADHRVRRSVPVRARRRAIRAPLGARRRDDRLDAHLAARSPRIIPKAKAANNPSSASCSSIDYFPLPKLLVWWDYPCVGPGCVIPPASPSATDVLRIVSKSVVLP